MLLTCPSPPWQKWNVPHARVDFIYERRRSGGCSRAHVPGPVFAPLCVWNEPLGFTVWDQMQKEEPFGIQNFVQNSKWTETRRFKSGRTHRKVQQDQTGRVKNTFYHKRSWFEWILWAKYSQPGSWHGAFASIGPIPNFLGRSLVTLWIIQSLCPEQSNILTYFSASLSCP